MKFKIISFGKKMENLKIAIENNTLGSEHASFLEKIEKGDVVLFNCSSEYWGMGIVSSDGFEERTRLWKDKPYPYRFRIEKISLFERSFSFKENEIDAHLREELGKGWAFKVVFSPRELPKIVNKKILELIQKLEKIDESHLTEWLDKIVSDNTQKRRKKLGLKVDEK